MASGVDPSARINRLHRLLVLIFAFSGTAVIGSSHFIPLSESDVGLLRRMPKELALPPFNIPLEMLLNHVLMSHNMQTRGRRVGDTFLRYGRSGKHPSQMRAESENSSEEFGQSSTEMEMMNRGDGKEMAPWMTNLSGQPDAIWYRVLRGRGKAAVRARRSPGNDTFIRFGRGSGGSFLRYGRVPTKLLPMMRKTFEEAPELLARDK